ncbi:IS30 family transposase [Mycoplana sp. BE70]|uniref:hypothetical protein n=1 Tax=Mycoplana sp. BE70 TaxID=2817775 RepID=UPI0028578A55|nr:hypothetical protein [Mycoplana sp. BE70]MDR6758154.1 IS30 family transposase [Mycoplana sp. BE70]
MRATTHETHLPQIDMGEHRKIARWRMAGIGIDRTATTAGRCKIDRRIRLELHPLSVRREMIYRSVYSPDGRAIKLWRHLPERCARRQPSGALNIKAPSCL